MVLSDRFKQAFKVALAMVITYGIALAMDWEKPFCAGLSVAFCSLATTEESLNRGVHRAVGTFLAGVAALIMVALFPQDRWPLLLAMSGFIALCTYRLSGGSRFTFIWFNAGFNVPIVAMLGGHVGLNSFDVIVLRVQETTLGVVVYSLVALLVWPRRGGADFENAVRSVCDVQRRLFGLYLKALGDRLQALFDAEPAAGSGLLARELLEDMRDWRVGVQQAFGRLSLDPGTVDHSTFRARVDARLERLEARMKAALDKADAAGVSDEERGNLHRLLGAYRGLSEALVDLAERATPIDWARLREARF